MMKYTQQQLDEAPKIEINGKSWSIPIFGPRQNRRIVPMISSLGNKTTTELNMDQMDNLYNMIYWAILRAYPEILEKDFMDWDIPLDEAMRAVPIITKQTGMMKLTKGSVLSVEQLIEHLQKEPDQKALVQFNLLKKPTGEETTTETKSTGTSSSQELSQPQD